MQFYERKFSDSKGNNLSEELLIKNIFNSRRGREKNVQNALNGIKKCELNFHREMEKIIKYFKIRDQSYNINIGLRQWFPTWGTSISRGT